MSIYLFIIVIIVILIGILVFCLRKYVPGLKPTQEDIDEATLIEEEVNRMIVNPEEKKVEDDEDDDLYDEDVNLNQDSKKDNKNEEEIKDNKIDE